MTSRTTLAAAVLLAAAALAAACSGGGSPRATPTPAGSPTPKIAPAAATAIAAGSNVPLMDFTDPDGRFTAKLPSTWSFEAHQPGYTAVRTPGDPIAAVISISCAPNQTADQLLQTDIGNSRTLGAVSNLQAASTSARPVTVAGLPARLILWQGKLGAVTLAHASYYLEGRGCAWRLMLTTYLPQGTLQAFQPLMDALTASFKLTPG